MTKIQLSTSYFPVQDDEFTRDSTVGGLLREVAGQTPDWPALIEVGMDGGRGRSWTFAALLDQAETLACALRSRFEPGEHVCIWAPNIPEWVLMEYACGLAGLVLVTANPAYQTRELRYVLEQSGAVALFLVPEFRGNPMAEIAAEATTGLAAIREVVDLRNSGQLFRTGNGPEDLPDVNAMDAVQIQYTSGTTGFPKGAVLSHRSVTNNARFYRDRLQAKNGAPWINVMPLFHTAGCGMAVLGALQAHAPIFMPPMFEPRLVLKLIEECKITIAGGVPTMMVAMLEVLKHEKYDLSSLTNMVSGGSMVAPDLVRQVTEVFGCSFQTVYGQTETSPLITQHHLGEALDDICDTVGQPFPQTEVSIRSVDDNAVLPLGKIGEICVRGYLRMIEYNDNPEATAATIDADEWLHTGDLGTMDSRGYLRVTGRVKEMIIRGGENLFPAEIENALLEHPDVAEVAVVGLPDDKWGEIVAAFVRPAPGAAVDPAALKAHCRERLAPMKSPVKWFSVDDFPMTGSGKIRKFTLRDKAVSGDFQPV